MTKSIAATAFLLLACALGVEAQRDVAQAQAVAIRDVPGTVAAVPFGPGERFTYKVSWGPVRGTAISEVRSVANVRGNQAYHLSFRVRGGTLGLKVDDHQESWLDVARLYSHRFKQDLDQPRYERLRTRDFYPAEGKWRQVEKPDSGELASREPLDDVSFLYWSRTLPLEVGRSYEFRRYYKESGNPVVVNVLRRQRVTVPAGTFNTIVVRPLIQTDGLFSEGGEAEVYYTDDARRLIVLVKTKLSIGTMTMELQDYRAGTQLR